MCEKQDIIRCHDTQVSLMVDVISLTRVAPFIGNKLKETKALLQS